MLVIAGAERMPGGGSLRHRRFVPACRQGGFQCALILLLAAFTCLEAAHASTRYDLAAIDAHIARTIDANRVPGAAVAIVDDGNVVFLRTYGNDGLGRPVTERTAFGLGSMSKAFTALAVMRLVERGEIALDTPVANLLPELALSGPEASERATLAHLLNHTSGLPARTPQAARSATLAEQVDALKHTRPTAGPMDRHMYTSANYLVAARMLEIATGQPFDAILRQNVLDPLGFDDPRASDASEASAGHRYWFAWPVAADLAAEPGRLAAASLRASVADMARFLLFQLGDGTWQGTRLLGESGMDAMHDGTAEGEGFRYGFGWRDGRLHGRRAIHHGGVLPDHQGMMVLLPDSNAGLVVLLNVSSALPLPVRPTSHRLAREIALYVIGEHPRSKWPTFRAWLLVFWAALGLIMLHQACSIVRILVGRDPAHHPGRAAAIDAAIMLAILIGLPLLLELSWPQIARQTPDLALWTAAMLALASTGVLVRSVRWLRPSVRVRPEGTG